MAVIMLSSCAGIKNTIHRASVDDGESFIKYGVAGHPDGVEVFKGSECLKTDAEIRRFNRQWDRQERRSVRESEKAEKKWQRRFDKISDKSHKEYLKTCCDD